MVKDGVKSDGMESTSSIIFERMIAAHMNRNDPSYPFPKFDQEQYYYKLQPAQESPPYPGKGSVFVDMSSGNLMIYVEDKPVSGT